MTTKTRDHSGQRYGALCIGERIADDPALHRAIQYRAQWACCGAELVIGQQKANAYRHPDNTPKTCAVCRWRTDLPVDAEPPPDLDGVWSAGWGWMPFIRGPMGQRGGIHGNAARWMDRSDC